MDKYILNFVMAAGITLAAGWLLIPMFRKLKFGQNIRSDGPGAHLSKAGTPTMGGVLFLAGTAAAVLFTVDVNPAIFTALTVTAAHGLMGFADDFIKIAAHRSLGLRARDKLLAQLLLGLGLAVMAVRISGGDTAVTVPLTGIEWELGTGYYFLVVLILMGTTNAVNLTDGADGLAAGAMLLSSLAYVIIALMMDNEGLALFSLAVAGGTAAFLFFNRHPARVFMGDTGSLALGAALASLAVLTGTELILPLVGGLYVIEALSVIIQVISFRLTGRRVFRMSPLHHHFELAGWPEVRVVIFFWLIALVSAVVGVAAMYNFQ